MNKLKPSQRLQALTPHFFSSLGARISAMQSEGRDIIRLDEGAPDLPPAPQIIQELSRTAASPKSHSYQSHRGHLALRQAWAEMYRREYGVQLDPETEILPLLGSKEGIFHLAMALVDPGDIVLVPDPGYITYTRGALFAGGEPFFFPLLPERSFLPEFGTIPDKVARRAKLLWLNYPNNPTSATAPLELYQEAVDFARKWGLLLCHDAAYAHVTYDGYCAPNLFQIPGAKEVAVEFNSLSKTYNMAGWRVAAVVGHPQALRYLFTLKTNQDSGHFLPVLEAATVALTGDQAWIRERNLIYKNRRDIVIRSLSNMGFRVVPPRASLYVWCPIPAGWRSESFCRALLEEANLSLTPGTVFGARGEGYVRISITAPEGRLISAMDRLENWMSSTRASVHPDIPRMAS